MRMVHDMVMVRVVVVMVVLVSNLIMLVLRLMLLMLKMMILVQLVFSDSCLDCFIILVVGGHLKWMITDCDIVVLLVLKLEVGKRTPCIQVSCLLV